MDSKGEQHQLNELKGVARKDSKGEQHQLKELKGVAAKDSKGEQPQLEELKGVAAKNSKMEHQRHHAFPCCYTWEMGSKSPPKVDTF